MCAFGFAVLAGLLIRRSIPAMIAAFIPWMAIRLVIEFVFRPHFMTPLTTTQPNCLPPTGCGSSIGSVPQATRRVGDWVLSINRAAIRQAPSPARNAKGQDPPVKSRQRKAASRATRKTDPLTQRGFRLAACAQNGTAAATARRLILWRRARSRRDGYDLLACTGLPPVRRDHPEAGLTHIRKSGRLPTQNLPGPGRAGAGLGTGVSTRCP